MYTIKIANNVTTTVPELKDFLYKSVLLTNFKCFNLNCYVGSIVSICFTSSPKAKITGYVDMDNDNVYLYQRQKFRKNKRSARNVITIYKVPVNKVKYAKQFNHYFKLELI